VGQSLNLQSKSCAVLDRDPVVIRDGAIGLQLNKNKLRELLLPGHDTADDDEIVSVDDKVEFQRHRGEIRRVLPVEAGSQTDRHEPALINAVARAHDWVGRILVGELPHQRAIAEKTGLNERCVSKIIQLAFLAPDMTEGILEGRQSPLLTLEACAKGIPAIWGAQRTCLANLI